MDIALKQRLVGATVLVALGVIFIPMLLDGPNGSGAERQSIRIPTPPDHRYQSRLLPVDPQPVAIDPEPSAALARFEQAPGSSEPIVAPAAIDRLMLPAGEATHRSTAAPSAAEQKPTAAINTSLGAPNSAKTDSAKTAAAKSAAAESTSAKTWILQLGSFGNAANAARLVESLQQQSFAGYQQKVAVGEVSMYRVLIGSWASKDLAAEAGAKVSDKFPKLDISVRQVDAATGKPLLVLAPGAAWMVQVGSFSQYNNALALRDKLRAGGFAAAIETTAKPNYKVLVGPSLSRAGAELMRDRLKREFAINGIVLGHP